MYGLPPIAVEMDEMEATPGGFPPGSRGHDTYFKLPPDSTDKDFGQLGDDYMDGELPAADSELLGHSLQTGVPVFA